MSEEDDGSVLMDVKLEGAAAVEEDEEVEESLRPGSPSSTLNSPFERARVPPVGREGGARINVHSIVFHRELGGGIYGQAGVGGSVYRGPRRRMVPGTPGGALVARSGLAAYSGADVSKMWYGFLEEDSLLRSQKQYCEVLPTPTSTIGIDVSPDGKYFASTHGKPDHSVRIIDCATLKCVRRLHGHVRTPWVVCFHPTDSNIVASGSLDQSVRIWDIERKRAICTWTAARAIASISFDAEGKVLAIASGRKGYLWDWTWRDEQGRRRLPQKVLRTKRTLRAIQFYPLSCVIPRASEARDAGAGPSGRPCIRREALLSAEVEDETVAEASWGGRGVEAGPTGRHGPTMPHTFGQRHHRLMREAGGLRGGGFGRSYTGRAVDALVRRPEYDPVELSELRQGNAAVLRQVAALSQRGPMPTEERAGTVRLRLWHYDPLSPMEVLEVSDRRGSDQNSPTNPAQSEQAHSTERSAPALDTIAVENADTEGERRGRGAKDPIFTLGNVVLCSETGVHMSRCGKYMAACVAWPGQTSGSFPSLSQGDVRYELQVFSLVASNFGQVIASRPVMCANNLTSVQFSPCSEHILIAYGRKNDRLKALAAPEDEQGDHLILEIYRLADMTLLRRVLSSDDEVNVAAFLPHACGGLVYGTKEGRVCRLAYDRSLEPTRELPVVQGDVQPWHSLSDLIATAEFSNVSLN